MASQTVSKSVPFLVFPTLNDVFTWRVVATETNRTISFHKNLANAVKKAEELNVVSFLREAVSVDPEPCAFEDERYPFPCGKDASFYDFDSEQFYCAGHTADVIR